MRRTAACAALALALAGCGLRERTTPPTPPADTVALAALGAVTHLADHLPPAPGPLALALPAAPGEAAAIPAGVSLEHFDRLRLRMRVSSEGWGAVRFETEREPVLVAHPGLGIPLTEGTEVQTWHVPLAHEDGYPYHGQAAAWTVHLPDTAAFTAVEEATLIPRERRLEVSFGGYSRDALAGDLHAWRFTVPKGGRLLAHTGYWHDEDRPLRGDGVRFEAWILPADGAPARVITRVAGPGQRGSTNHWFAEEADLSAWAGREVTLALRIHTRRGAEADYAFWGSPVLVAPEAPPPGPPVFLISCDTFRADHLSVQGYGRGTTPRLEAFARDAVVFEQAVTNESWTLTAHMSMLTGMHAVRHGMTPSHNLREDIPTLAEILRARGYATAGHVGHEWWLLPWRGYGRGFNEYGTPTFYRDVFAVHADAQAYLARMATPGVFLFLHNYDAHSRVGDSRPYDADDQRFTAFASSLGPSPDFMRPGLPHVRATDFLAGHNNGLLTVSDEEREHLVAHYDDAIKKVDFAVGEFLDNLKARGLYDDALIIITSDHGESFNEHGRFLHGEVNEACLRIPLLVKWPGNTHGGTRHAGMVEQMDIFPTVLEAAGASVPDGIDGVSLLARLTGAAPPVSKSFSRRNAWRGLRTDPWKLRVELDRQEVVLFDLSADPHEQNDLAALHPERAAAMRAELEAFYRPQPAGWVVGLDSGGADWRGTVRISSNARIVWAGMERGNLLHSDAPVVEADFRLDAGRPRDAIVVETDPPRAPIRVDLQSDTPFVAGHGGAVLPADTAQRIALSVDTPLGPEPDAALPHPRAWTAWRDAPMAQGQEARPADEDALEQLRSLGYLDK